LLSDLYISVKGGRVVLWSRKLGKRVLPRLTHAYNYRLTSLPVFRFLCDMQGQGDQKHLGFSWGILASRFVFLPRATWKGHVLSRATWQFSAEHTKSLWDTGGSAVERLTQWRDQWGVPATFVLVEGDNELLIEAKKVLWADIFLKMARRQSSFKLVEYLPTGEGVVRSKEGASYNGQFIASFVKMPGADAEVKEIIRPRKEVRRTFAPGNEWLYFKWYCGELSADIVLEIALRPLVEELRMKGVVRQWFFIRYADPGFHLRVRFLLNRLDDIGIVLQLVSSRLSIYEANGVVWKTQLDTYNRELERYGTWNMGNSEQIFQISSEAVLEYLACAEPSRIPQWMFAASGLHELMTVFGWGIPEKLEFVSKMYARLASELDVQEQVRKETDKQYRLYAREISRSLEGDTDPINERFIQGLKILATEILGFERDGLLEVPIRDLVASYAHMHLNRLFVTESRVQEMVVYDLLKRYYVSWMAKKKWL